MAVGCWNALREGLLPTGFGQYDMPYYLANARQMFDEGFSLVYSNPYAPYGSPEIYFQPQSLLMGLMVQTGLDPGLVLCLFWLAAVAFAATVAARLYEEIVGWTTRAHKLGFLCFFWGGGVIGLFGLVVGWFSGLPVSKAVIQVDPGDGYWFLNFGRNLVYPTEAYYHGVFLLAILLLLKRRLGWALAASALLSISHPFTGLSVALIVTGYAAVELTLKSGAVSWKLLAGGAAITAVHLGYYMVFLNRFPDHRVLQSQWQLGWFYPPWSMFLALYLVGSLTLPQVTHWDKLKQVVADPRSRLYLVWFVVIMALTHHDLVMQSLQPIHFARGYDWMALFFLASPALIALLDRLLRIRAPQWRVAAVTIFLLLMVSDNLLWFTSVGDPAADNYPIAVTPDQRDILDWLAANGEPPAYVASVSDDINYLTNTYTTLRSWHGHRLNTPHARSRLDQLQAAFEQGDRLPADQPVYYIPSRESHWTAPASADRVYSNPSFTIWLDRPDQTDRSSR